MGISMDILRSVGDPSVWLSSVVCVLAVASYLYYENSYRYWEKRGVKGAKPWPLVSQICDLFLSDRAEAILAARNKFGKVWGSFAIFKPRLVVADAELIRQICIKDFDTFQNHEVNEWHNKYQRNFLVWLQGDHWRWARTMMTPCFTSGKMKRMFKVMDVCADDLVDNFREQLDRQQRRQLLADQSAGRRPSNQANNRPFQCIVDLYDTFSMYTLDGITSCCYGIRLKREVKGDSSDSGGRSRKTSSSSSSQSSASSRNSLLEDCRGVTTSFDWRRMLMVLLLPKWLLRLVGFQVTPESHSRALVERIKKLIEIRRRQSSKKYDDLLQMLVDARLDDKLELTDLDQAENHHAGLSHEALINHHEESVRSTLLREKSLNDSKTIRQAIKSVNQMDDLEILSEAALLIVVGLDTTRTSLSTISYLLAHNPHVQEKLYDELKKIAVYEENQVGKHLKFEYDSLTSCQYLDAVICESLRYLAPAPYTDRIVGHDYHLEKYNVHLRKGEQILLGLHAVHNDPDYWPEPRLFKPERFMAGPEGRDRIVPGSYAPFSMGPRHCIGMRFSLTETKLGLAKVIMNFRLEPVVGSQYPPKTRLGVGLCQVKDCRCLVSLREEEAASF